MREEARSPWLQFVDRHGSIIIGLLLAAAALVFLGPGVVSESHFDLPKRIIWTLVAICSIPFVLRTGTWRRDPLAIAGLVLAAWMLLRTLLRPHPLAELGVVFTWLLPLTLFFAGYAMPRNALETVARFAFGVGCVQALLMLLQRSGFDPFLGATTSAMDYAPGRMIGTIGYHNQAVDFLAICCSCGILLTTRDAFRLTCIVVAIGVACLTGSRGGILALGSASVASMLCTRFTYPGRRLRAPLLYAAAACLALVAMVVVTPVAASRMGSLLADFRASPGVAPRILMARAGVEMVAERPVAGWGAGEYAYQYLDRIADILPAQKTHAILESVVFARETHNDYVQFAAEFGMTGAILALVFFWVILRRLWGIRLSSPAVFASTVMILGYMAVKAAVSFPWQTSAAGPLAALLVGLMTPHDHSTAAEIPCARPRCAGDWPVPAMVIVLLTLVSGWWFVEGVQIVAVSHVASNPRPAELAKTLVPWAYRQQALVGAACAARGEYPEAEALLERARTGYLDIPLLNNLGHTLVAEEKWGDALECYDLWARTGLDHSNALSNVSICYENLGRFSEAARTADRLHELWPDWSDGGALRRGALHLFADEPAEALEGLRLYMRKARKEKWGISAQAHNMIGASFLRVEKPRMAKRAFRKALQIDPALVSAQRNLDLLRAQGF